MGNQCQVNELVQSVISKTHQAQLPIGALCIAPALLAKVLGQVKLTLGTDKDVHAAVERCGATSAETNSGEIIVDEQNKIVTAPCYMHDARISEIAQEAHLVVQQLIKWIES